MALSFGALCQIMEQGNMASPLMTSGEDERAVRIVKKGMELRSEDGSSFWDDFISLCGDPDGIAQLLNVNREKVASWPSLIADMQDRAENELAQDPDRTKQEVMPTGDTGAVTNVDPPLGQA